MIERFVNLRERLVQNLVNPLPVRPLGPLIFCTTKRKVSK